MDPHNYRNGTLGTGFARIDVQQQFTPVDFRIGDIGVLDDPGWQSLLAILGSSGPTSTNQARYDQQDSGEARHGSANSVDRWIVDWRGGARI